MTVYSFLIYAKETPKSFSGILGEIDLHTIHFLLLGGKEIPQEEYSSREKVVEWYSAFLESNGIFATMKKMTGNTLWFQVDLEKTKLEEFTQFHEMSKEDTDTFVWRTYWYPCSKDTKRECLGFAISTLEQTISGVSLDALIQKVIETP